MKFLQKEKYKVVIEADTAELLKFKNFISIPKEEFGKHCDLVIVVGGDGSLLNAAHLVVNHGTPVLGINRGRLGFLTDIHPDELTTKISTVLAGHYIAEKRFLLDTQIRRKNKVVHQDVALNEVVLSPGEYSHMLEFEIYIDQKLVCSQRADGQIIATPTGSTAYALSAGGPILHPQLNAIVLVPMFPHKLSSRPVVIDGNSEIDIVLLPKYETAAQFSCDGKERVAIALGDRLHVKKKKEELTLLHPADYDYYETLREKLMWERKLS